MHLATCVGKMKISSSLVPHCLQACQALYHLFGQTEGMLFFGAACQKALKKSQAMCHLCGHAEDKLSLYAAFSECAYFMPPALYVQAESKLFLGAAMPEGVKVKPYVICVGKLKVSSSLVPPCQRALKSSLMSFVWAS